MGQPSLRNTGSKNGDWAWAEAGFVARDPLDRLRAPSPVEGRAT